MLALRSVFVTFLYKYINHVIHVNRPVNIFQGFISESELP